MKDDHGAARAVALDVKPVAADVDHLAGCGLRGATSGCTDGREGTADGDEQEGGDHGDDEPAAAAVEVPSHLHEHPDGEGGERRGPDPTEQVHRGRTGLEHDQAEPDDAEEHRRHHHPGLRLGAIAGRQDCHQAPAESEGEQHGPSDHRLRAARCRTE